MSFSTSHLSKQNQFLSNNVLSIFWSENNQHLLITNQFHIISYATLITVFTQVTTPLNQN